MLFVVLHCTFDLCAASHDLPAEARLVVRGILFVLFIHVEIP